MSRARGRRQQLASVPEHEQAAEGPGAGAVAEMMQLIDLMETAGGSRWLADTGCKLAEQQPVSLRLCCSGGESWRHHVGSRRRTNDTEARVQKAPGPFTRQGVVL
jgi:hypothetical protein